jgi:hypothetical protein
MDPTMHTVNPENKGILKLKNEVINIRSMLPGPLNRDCPIVLGKIHPTIFKGDIV